MPNGTPYKDDRPPFAEATYTLLRVIVGVVMAFHGWLKLSDMAAWTAQVEQLGIPAPAIMAWVAMSAELLGGIGFVLGLLTRIAALGIGAVMAVAIVQVHLSHGLSMESGGFEYPLVLLCVALLYLQRGAGPASLDAIIHKRL